MRRPRPLPAHASRRRCDTTIDGVRLGVQTYSFRELPRPAGAPTPSTLIIKAMKDMRPQRVRAVGAAARAGSSPPAAARAARRRRRKRVKAREDLRKWRLETPLDHFRRVRKKFDAAGITIYAYNYSINDELHRRRDRSRLRDRPGARRRASSRRRRRSTSRKRMAPFADKHKIVVGDAQPLEHRATRTSSRRPRASPRR